MKDPILDRYYGTAKPTSEDVRIVVYRARCETIEALTSIPAGVGDSCCAVTERRIRIAVCHGHLGRWSHAPRTPRRRWSRCRE